MIYPFAEPPAFGRAVEVAPGVLWIRLPMPLGLDHINVWAIEDGDSFTLIDTGLYTEATSRLWDEISSCYLSGRPVKRVLVTHAHEDHIGAAGWFAANYGSELWMTADEYADARETLARRGQEPSVAYLQFYRAAGLADAALKECEAAYSRSGRWIYPLPKHCSPLEDGDELTIGDHLWRVITGSGHSKRHACLYCPRMGLLISGDQVLPRISSNVSVRHTDPDDDPLSRWFTSLSKLHIAVPGTVLVLPAHNTCFFGLHARLEHLRRSHNAALERLMDALDTPKRVIDTFVPLFRREIKNGSTLRLAVGEAMANLNYLCGKGLVSRVSGHDGVHQYIRVTDPGIHASTRGTDLHDSA